MATKFFISGGVNSNFTDNTNWSTTDGGPNDTTAPGPADWARLTFNSPSCFIDADTSVQSMSAAAGSGAKFSGTLTHSANITVNAGWELPGPCTYTPQTYRVNFSGTGSIKSGNHNHYDVHQIAPGTLTLLDNNLTVTNSVTLNAAGTLNCNTKFLILTGTGTVLEDNGATLTGGTIRYNLAISNRSVNVAGATHGVTQSLQIYSTASSTTYNLIGNLTTNGGALLISNTGLHNTNINCNNWDWTSAGNITFGFGGITGPITLNTGHSSLDLNSGFLVTANSGTHYITTESGSTIDVNGSLNLKDGTGEVNITDNNCTWTFDGTPRTLDFNSQSIYNLVADGNSTLASSVTVLNDFTVNSTKAIDFDSYIISVANNVTNLGTITPSTSSFSMNGAGAQSFTGDASFNNFAVTGGDRIVTFQHGKTVNVSGTLDFKGTAGNLLTLSSNFAGTPTGLDFSGGSQNVEYVSVSDNDASAGTQIDASDGTSVDGGGTTNWNFGASAGAGLGFTGIMGIIE